MLLINLSGLFANPLIAIVIIMATFTTFITIAFHIIVALKFVVEHCQLPNFILRTNFLNKGMFFNSQIH